VDRRRAVEAVKRKRNASWNRTSISHIMDTDTNLLELIDAEDDAHDPVLCQYHLDSGILESSFKPGNVCGTWIWAVSTCAKMDNRFVSLLVRPSENVELEAFVQRCIDTGTCNDLFRLR
jgi:hypothetical protein